MEKKRSEWMKKKRKWIRRNQEKRNLVEKGRGFQLSLDPSSDGFNVSRLNL